MNEKTYTITEISHQLSVPRHKVTYLCSHGLIPHIKRDKRHHRIFTAEQVELISLFLKMRAAGFTRLELKAYSRLYRAGVSTETERIAILTTRKRQLWQEIKERQEAIDFIERQEELAKAERAL